MIQIESNALLPSRIVTGWRICIDNWKLNKATRKDHFPLPLLDRMLDRLAGHEYYCFLDGYSGYNQITISPEDQEKTNLHARMVCLHLGECSLGYVTHQARFSAA